jgi:endoglucanase
MYSLPIALILVTTISLIITYFSINIRKTSMEMVNAMGIGLNLGSTFDSFLNGSKIKTPIEQITLFGNNIPTKKMITNIKKNGIKTIRLPVTWIYFIDESGNIDSEWMYIIKKVVKMIIKEKMYCILNIHHDTDKGNWLGEETNSKDKYMNLWKNIANEFKNYNDYLIFEALDDINYSYNSDFMHIYELNDAFIQVVRSSGGKNEERLLILAGANKNIDLICSPEYKLPIDPSRRFAISVHYYVPEEFTIDPDDNPWTWNDNGTEKIIQPVTEWGNENDYKDMITNFESMKKVFLDKNIPVIIVEVGVLTEQKKNPESISKYLYFEFSLSSTYNGIMSCLFDDSNKKSGKLNYYDRENNIWYNQKIGENIKLISKNKFVKPNEYFILSNKETISTITKNGILIIKFGKKRVMTIIFNAFIKISERVNVGFGITSYDSSGKWFGKGISGILGEKIYDGSYTFTINVRNEDYNDRIEIQKWWGNENSILNYLTIEFERKYIFFDYNSYIKNLS